MTLRIISNILVVGASLVTLAHGSMGGWDGGWEIGDLLGGQTSALRMKLHGGVSYVGDLDDKNSFLMGINTSFFEPEGTSPSLGSLVAELPPIGSLVGQDLPPAATNFLGLTEHQWVAGLLPASAPEAPVTGQPVLGITPHPGSPPQPGPLPKRRKGLDGMPVPVSPEDQAIILSNPMVKKALGRIGTAIGFRDIRRETNRIVAYLMEKIREGGGSLTEESVAQYIEQNKDVLEQEVFTIKLSPKERTIFQNLLKHSQNPGDTVQQLLDSRVFSPADCETLETWRNPTDTNLIQERAEQQKAERLRLEIEKGKNQKNLKQSTTPIPVRVDQDFAEYKPVLEEYRITIGILQAFVKDAYGALTGDGYFSNSLFYNKINAASKKIYRLLKAEATTKERPLTDAEVAICLHRNPAMQIIEFDQSHVTLCINMLQNFKGDHKTKNEGLVRLLAAGVFKVADLAVAGIPFDEAAKKAAVDFLTGLTGYRQKKIAAINFLAAGVLSREELAVAGIQFDQLNKHVAITFLRGLKTANNQTIAGINFLAAGVFSREELAAAGINLTDAEAAQAEKARFEATTAAAPVSLAQSPVSDSAQRGSWGLGDLLGGPPQPPLFGAPGQPLPFGAPGQHFSPEEDALFAALSALIK